MPRAPHQRASTALTLAAAAALLLTMSPAPTAAAAPVLCSTLPAVAAQIDACENAAGVTLALPLTRAQVACLYTTANALPDCALTADGPSLAAIVADRAGRFERSLQAATSNAGSLSTGETPTPTPAVVTPTPTPSPRTPAPVVTPTVTPSPVTPPPVTPAPETTPPPTPATDPTTPAPSLTPRTPTPSGGGGEGVTPTTAPPPLVTTTTAPTTTPRTRTPGSSASSNSGSGSDSSSNGSGNQNSSDKSDGSTDSTVLIVGIAGGVVFIVILLATLIVCRQRHRDRARKSDVDALESPQTRQGTGSTPFSAAPSPAGGRSTSERGAMTQYYPGTATTAGHSAAAAARRSTEGNSTGSTGRFSLPLTGGLWDDEAIIAVRIPREKVFSDVLLSRGGYGEVYRGMYNGQAVAVKTLLPERRKDMKQINAFLAEVKLMAALEHAQIVRFVGVAWDSLTDLCVVSEYMEGGDLRSTLTRFEDVEHRRHGFDADKIRIALHIAHALTYLHSLQPIVLHRDLKSKNILLDNQLNAKLTDFGVSRERSDRTMTAGVGTSLWMAPEVMLGERYDEKSDIFSFGVVLSELDSHLLPYAQVTESMSSGESRRIPDTAILQMVSLGRLRVQFSAHANPAVVALALACVSVDPGERPTAADVLYKLHSLRKSY